MKPATLLPLLAFIAINTYGQAYSILGKASNGSIIKDNHVFYLDDQARFSVTNENGEAIHFYSCEWSIESFDEQSGEKICHKLSDACALNFSLNTDIIPIAWLSRLKRTVEPNDLNVYHIVKIICSGTMEDQTEVSVEKTIRLNILPIRSKLTMEDFHCEVCSLNTDEWGNAYASFSITQQQRNDDSRVILKEYDEYGLITSVSYPIPSNGELFRYEFLYPYAEGEYGTLQVVSTNIFGYVESDTFFVYNELLDKFSSLESIIPASDQTMLYPNPVTDYFMLTRITEPVEQIILTDMQGAQVKSLNYIPSMKIDVSDLQQGIYHITIFYRNNHKDTIRFIKL